MVDTTAVSPSKTSSRIDYLIFGYCRVTTAISNIKDIIPLIITYYNSPAERFALHSDDMVVSSGEYGPDSVVNAKSGSSWVMAYGVIPILIDSNSTDVFEWAISCNANNVWFGISEIDNKTLEYGYCYYNFSECKYYGFHGNGNKISHSFNGYSGNYA